MTDRDWNENDWHEWRGRTEQIMSQQTQILTEIKDWLKEHARDEMGFQANMQSHISAAAESRNAMESNFIKMEEDLEELSREHSQLRSKVDELIGQIKNWKIVVTICLTLAGIFGALWAEHLFNWREKVTELIDKRAAIYERYQNFDDSDNNGTE